MAANSPTLLKRGLDIAKNTIGILISSPQQSQLENPQATTATSGNQSSAQQGPPDREALAEAVRMSLEDQAKGQKKGAKYARASSGPSRSLPEASADLVLSLNNEFTSLCDSEGDTAIYIGPPPRMPEQTEREYDYIVKHFDKVHVVMSITLRLMGEESRFTDTDLLNPTKSFRAERRLRKLGVLFSAEAKHGGKFKYYIDLRPPKEDEEAVVLITELTCTKGVLTWHLASDKYDLDPLVVLGHDEFGRQSPVGALPTQENSSDAKDEDKTKANASKPEDNPPKQNTPSPIQLPEPKIAPEYTPLRHCSAIERLLHAIHGNDPKLDSAPKVWTYFAIARYFGCATHERVSGWITAWIYSHNNANFIQNNPEVAYRIAMGIRSPDLIRDSFSILVGERALLDVYGEYNPSILNPLVKTVHGRKLELLDDDERNRIDHAASSLVHRIRETIHYLCRDMGWLQESRDYNKLNSLVGESALESETLKTTKTLIMEYVRSRIYYVLCQDQFAFDELEHNPLSTLSFRSASDENYVTVYNSLNQPMRMFTKSFWLALQRTQFDVGTTNTSTAGTIGGRNITRYIDGLQSLYKDDPLNGITTISRAALEDSIMAVNRLLYTREVGGKGKGRSQHHISNGEHHEQIKDAGFPIAPSAASGHKMERPLIEDGTPAKRRKTLEADDLSSLSIDPGLLSHDTGSKSPLWCSTDRHLTSVAQASVALKNQPVLAIRPKPKDAPVAVRMKDSMRDILNESKSQGPPTVCDPLMEQTPSFGESGDAFDEQIATIQGQAVVAAESSATINPNPSPTSILAASSSSSYTNKSWAGSWNKGQQPRAPDADDKADLHRSLYLQPASVTPSKPYKVSSNNKYKHTNSDQIPPTPGNLYKDTDLDPCFYPINLGAMLHSFSKSVSNVCSSILYPSHLFHQTGLIPTNLFDTLLCLDANEFRYLPLWAPDGNDDDTGGVFDECPVPNLDIANSKYEPFSAGRIRKGYDQRGESEVGSFEDITSQAISTVGMASKLATDGTETVKSLDAISVGENAAGGVDSETALVYESKSVAPSVVSVDGWKDEESDSEAGFCDEDDTDTLDGEGGVEKEMSSSLQAFLNSDGENTGYLIDQDTDANSLIKGESAIFLSSASIDLGEPTANIPTTFSAVPKGASSPPNSMAHPIMVSDADRGKGKGKAVEATLPYRQSARGFDSAFTIKHEAADNAEEEREPKLELEDDEHDDFELL